MNKVLKMDLYRLVHSIVFYVCLGFITMMAVAMVMSASNTTLDTLMGVSKNVDPGDAFMASMTGTGVINILLGITLALFVSGDFTSGFIKNILTVHSSFKDYFLDKLASFGTLSLFMMLFYTIESILALMIFGNGVAFSGGIFGFVVFLLEKWIISLAFCSVILLIVLWTRKAAWGIIAGFIIATGGLSMMIPGLANMFHWDWLNAVYAITLSGASSSIDVSFNALNLIHIIFVGLGYFGLTSILALRMMKTKDIL